MKRSYGVAALAVLVVSLLLSTSISVVSITNHPDGAGLGSVTSTNVPLTSSVIENFSLSNQFKAGTIFDNQSYSISVDQSSQDFAIGDLNHDGLSDVAVISKQTNQICIYNRSATGALSINPWKISKSGVADMRSIAIGDLNNDGLNDIVVSYNDSLAGEGYLAIFYQSATTHLFDPATSVQCKLGNLEPYKVIIGNFNKTDVCVATICMGIPSLVDDQIVIWKAPFNNIYNDRYRINIPIFTKSKIMAAGDINGDGLPDLVVANSGGSDVYIAKQSGTWGSWTLTPKLISGSCSDLLIKDITGDGKNDLVFADTTITGSYSAAIIYPNDGTGLRTNPLNAPLKTPMGQLTIAAGNLSNDSRTDLIVLSSG